MIKQGLAMIAGPCVFYPCGVHESVQLKPAPPRRSRDADGWLTQPITLGRSDVSLFLSDVPGSARAPLRMQTLQSSHGITGKCDGKAIDSLNNSTL
jgi:hypothetical protein